MAVPQSKPVQLSETPDVVTWPEKYYVFIEKVGPFQINAPQAWQEFHQKTSAIAEHNTITGYFSLYKVDKQVYRAGVSVAAKPKNLPSGVEYEKFEGGKYGRFILTGSYSQLPEACGRAFEIVRERKIPVRDGYNIENYVNDPRTTPEDELITEIMFPTKMRRFPT
jgi:effector-binding domain-containing protein